MLLSGAATVIAAFGTAVMDGVGAGRLGMAFVTAGWLALAVRSGQNVTAPGQHRGGPPGFEIERAEFKFMGNRVVFKRRPGASGEVGREHADEAAPSHVEP